VVVGESPPPALDGRSGGRIAYQFFGGFYSNAEHPDIIRGYALLPWFLGGLSVTNVSADSPQRPLLLVPLCTYLLATGAYPALPSLRSGSAAGWSCSR